jgi:AraC-like DNA-binding protein
VLRAEYALDAPEVGAQLRQLELRCVGFSVTWAHYNGCRFYDGSRLPCARGSQWAKVTIILGGEVACVDTGTRFGRGRVIAAPSRGVGPLEPTGASCTALRVAWRKRGPLGSDGSVGVERLGPRALGRLDRLAELDVASGLTDVASILAATGFSTDVRGLPEALAATPTADAHTLAVLAALVSDLRGQPMMVDLSTRLGLSPRQAARRTADLLERSYASVDTWQRFVAVWRLTAASLLVRAGPAPLAWVAQRCGYGSVAALCHALSRAGLPPPRALSRWLAVPGEVEAQIV